MRAIEQERQYVHVVRYQDTNEMDDIYSGVIGVYDSRELGLKAALVATGEYVDWQWDNWFHAEDLAEYKALVSEGEYEKALEWWNSRRPEYIIKVSVDQIESADDGIEDLTANMFDTY